MPVCSNDRSSNAPLLYRVILEDGQNYMPIVVQVVQKMRRQAAANVLEYEDAVAEALLGLSQAKARFKPKHKSKATLKSYAYWRMRGALLDSSTREFVYKTRNDNVEDDHIAGLHHYDSHEDELAKRELIERVRQVMLRTLASPEYIAVVMCFIEDEPDEVIAKVIHCSATRVAQYRKTGIEKLRRAFGVREAVN
jgi:RNA polymerase sigma factor (sigma-70 family)